MKENLKKLDKETLINLFFDSLHLTVLHYGLWFRETEHQLGLDKTIAIEKAVWDRLLPTFMRRLAQDLKIPTKGHTLEPLASLSKEELVDLLEDMQKNWLASDGVWFQTIEKNYDYEMFTAKRINDTCWTRFAYIEAKTIMGRFGIPENGGLEALKTALQYKLYSLIYKFKVVEEDHRLLLKITDCRVQEARRRQGYPEYPCKSAGVTEHVRFAEAIDPRIKVKCLSCPPDPSTGQYNCAWEFELNSGGQH